MLIVMLPCIGVLGTLSDSQGGLSAWFISLRRRDSNITCSNKCSNTASIWDMQEEEGEKVYALEGHSY